MYYVLFTIHLLIALLLCVVVLLQRSKGNGLAGAFGGMGAGEAMFGAHGVTTILHKATIWLAVFFMVSSMGMAIFVARQGQGNGGNLSRRAAERVPVSSAATAAVPVEGGGLTLPSEGNDDVVPPADAAAAQAANSEGDEKANDATQRDSSSETSGGGN